MVDFGAAGKNRFVCPNDRQLSLRAKYERKKQLLNCSRNQRLRTGWSVKTGSLGYQNSLQPIDNDEQAAIIEVIRRAERVDHMEQERVGRLVERLENMRRNALGKNPSQCLLCGDHFGVLGAQKLKCADCKQLVCSKCSIENPKSPKDSFLCMICAETREIWKKSGAWFFKALPKYVLPGQRCFLGKNRCSRRSKCGGSQRDEDSSSDEDRRPWKILETRITRTESTHEVDGVKTPEPPGVYQRQKSSPDTYLSKDFEPLKNYMSHLNLGELKSWDETEYLEVSSRRGSIISEGSEVRSEERGSPSASSTSSSLLRHTLEDASFGIMELALTYDPLSSVLHCIVYRAKNLLGTDINGLSDPFCKLNVLPNGKANARLRTKTVPKTRSPEFNENLAFYEISESDLNVKSLHVLVVDDDKYGHDYLGEVRIALGKLKMQNTIYLTLPLERLHVEGKGPNPSPDLNQWFDDLWLRGQILLSLCYSTKRRALLVTIVRCSNLLPMDNNGFSDPFVKLHLKPDPYHRKHKTSIKWKNLNPVYNEEFAFESRPNELASQSLHLAVWDKDYGKSNDYLGGLVIGGVGSKGQRLKHWLDMIRYPDHRHEFWHNLTEDQIAD